MRELRKETETGVLGYSDGDVLLHIRNERTPKGDGNYPLFFFV